MVDVSEYSRFEIFKAFLQGWGAREIPQAMIRKVNVIITRLENLLQTTHLSEIVEVARQEGIEAFKDYEK